MSYNPKTGMYEGYIYWVENLLNGMSMKKKLVTILTMVIMHLYRIIL